MTIASTINKDIYQGNGNTKAWPITFPFTDVSQIKVYITDNYDLTTELTSDFLIDLPNRQVLYPGYKGIPPLGAKQVLPSGWKITIYRSLPLTQEIALSNQGPWDPDVMETGLDKIAMIQQQQQETLDRCVKLDISDTGKTEDYLKNINAAASSAAASSISASNSASIATVKADEAATSAVNAAVSAASINPSNLVNVNDVVSVAAPNKLLKLDGNGNMPAISAGLGTKRLDESNIGAGKGLVYNSTTGNIEYSAIDLPGVGDYLASGRNITSTGLNLNITSGVEYITNKKIERNLNTLSVPPRTAALIYDKSDGTSGYIPAAFPTADSGTINRWIIDGSASIASTVGTNALTKTGTVTQVDGWCGYGGKADGSTGKYQSTSGTGIPTGSAVRQFDIVFTPSQSTSIQSLLMVGDGTTATFGLEIAANSTRLTVYTPNAMNDTGFDIVYGSTYYAALLYDGTKAYLYINGNLVYTLTIAISTNATAVYLFYWSPRATYASSTIHYVEIRNSLRTPAQIAAVSNGLLIPCQYMVYTSNTQSIASVIDRSEGTPIGNMISSGGLGAAFDGVTIQADTACAVYPNQGTGAYTSWIGKDFGDKKRVITTMTVTGSSNYGLSSGLTNIVATMRGSQDGVNWDVLDTQTSVGGTAGASATFSNSSITPYRMIIVNMVEQTATAAHGMMVAEVSMSGYPVTSSNSDIRSVLPSNAISIGYIETSSTNVKVIVDGSNPKGAMADWAYGLRIGPNGMNNRKKFLGFKYFSGAVALTWANPFSTRKIHEWYSWAQDVNGMNETNAPTAWMNGNGSVWYGVGGSGSVTNQSNSSNRLQAIVGSYALLFNNTWQTTGYIGCYVEVFD